MATDHADFPPDPTQSDDALDCWPSPPPFSSFKVSDYTELAGALELPAHENVQPSSQLQALTDWFAIPSPHDPDHETLINTVPVHALAGFEGLTFQFDLSLQAQPTSFGTLLHDPPDILPYNSPDIHYLPEMTTSTLTHILQSPCDSVPYIHGQHEGCRPLPDNQEHGSLSFEDSGQGNEGLKGNSFDSRSLSHPRSGLSDRTPGTSRSPSPSQPGSSSGGPAPTVWHSARIDRNAPSNVSPSSEGTCNNHFLDEDALIDVPPSSAGQVYCDAAASGGKYLHHMVPSGGAVSLGRVENYIQNHLDGKFECAWVSETGAYCGFVSRWGLVKRHVRRMHYLEK